MQRDAKKIVVKAVEDNTTGEVSVNTFPLVVMDQRAQLACEFAKQSAPLVASGAVMLDLATERICDYVKRLWEQFESRGWLEACPLPKPDPTTHHFVGDPDYQGDDSDYDNDRL